MITAFAQRGFAMLPAVVANEMCQDLAAQYALGGGALAGDRDMLQHSSCQELAALLRERVLAPCGLSPTLVAVQCTLFEKSAECNWLVPLHQDRSIPVAAVVGAPSLSGWSQKDGVQFVHAPADVLPQLVAVRLHLDPCRAEDGPLYVVPGSHRYGVLSAAQAQALRASLGSEPCIANCGDVLVMRPALLHASSKSQGASRRRVLHFLFGPATLPHGLQWRCSV